MGIENWQLNTSYPLYIAVFVSAGTAFFIVRIFTYYVYVLRIFYCIQHLYSDQIGHVAINY